MSTERPPGSLDDELGSLASLLRRVAESPSTPPEELLAGIDDPDLEIERRLGAGGMGVVFLARDVRLDRRVAVKVHRLSGRPGATAALLAEAQAMARLADPNVVAVYDVREAAGHLLLMMEYVPGQTLREWLAAAPRDRDAILDAFAAAGAGLAAAHAAGLVHRDFKPDNVIVGDDGRVRVADFGLALDVEQGEGAPMADEPPAHVAGTPAYMAPEQIERGQVDARTDQYAFCLALVEALRGRHPLADSTSTEELLDSEVRAALPRSPGVARVAPAWLRRIVARGLAPDPAARFPDMDALLRALRRGRERRRRIALAAAALVVVAGAVALAWFRGGPRGPSCDGAPAALAGVWDTDVARRVDAAFTATGLPHAAGVWQVVGPHLDAYRASWIATRTHVCRAGARGEATPRMVELGMACLDRDRAQLAEIAARLARPDRALVNAAVDAATALPDPDACADARRLALEVAPPADDATRRAVADLGAELGRIDALDRLGLIAEANRRADRAVARARTVGYPPALAAALDQLGRARALAAKDGEAMDAQIEALATAYAAHDDPRVARVLPGLVQAAGVLGRPEAERWRRLALASIQRLGGDPLLEASVRCGHVTALVQGGHADQAIPEGKRCVELTEHALGPDAGDTGRALARLGLAEVAGGAYQDAEATLGRALRVIERAYGPDHVETSWVLNNLSSVERRLGRLDDGLAHARRALEIGKRMYGDDDPRLLEPNTTIGTLLAERGDYDAAAPYFDAALAEGAARYGPDDPRVGEQLGNVAIVTFSAGRLPRARELARRSVAVLERAGKPTEDLVNAYTLLGTLDREAGDVDAALAAHEHAVSMLDAVFPPAHPQRINPLIELGHTLAARKQHARAARTLEQAVALLGADAPPQWAGEARFALAQALIASGGDRRRARALAGQARADYQKVGAPMAAQVREIDAWLARAGR
jgi:eukaryotic-like serine/threonine-protein kinase